MKRILSGFRSPEKVKEGQYSVNSGLIGKNFVDDFKKIPAITHISSY